MKGSYDGNIIKAALVQYDGGGMSTTDSATTTTALTTTTTTTAAAETVDDTATATEAVNDVSSPSAKNNVENVPPMSSISHKVTKRIKRSEGSSSKRGKTAGKSRVGAGAKKSKSGGVVGGESRTNNSQRSLGSLGMNAISFIILLTIVMDYFRY